jgi:hypothetical protein
MILLIFSISSIITTPCKQMKNKFNLVILHMVDKVHPRGMIRHYMQDAKQYCEHSTHIVTENNNEYFY